MRRRWGLAIALTVVAMAACTTGPGTGETAPTGTAAPSTAAATVDDTMLLEAAEMPAWNNAGTWAVVDDTPAVRGCDLPTAESLGATVAISRTFTFEVALAEGDSVDPAAVPMLGVSTVGAYPDEASAAQAVTAVLDALAVCDAVPLGTAPGGSTWTYSAPDPASPDNAFFEFVGVTAKGVRTTLVAFSVYGQDANYEDDPLLASFEAAVDRLPSRGR
jgi:hypothetical protein